MTRVKLPELSPSAAPEFVDAASCKAWLEHVPLANVGVAQQQLLGQLVELNRFPISAANRLAVMESLREAVNFVQIEQARRFTNRALPLAEAEAAVFRDTDALWAQMRLSYLRCLDSAASGDAALRAQAALICQRLLACAGLRMFHHYRAYCEIPAEDWRALHEPYAKAEELEVSEEPVKDFLNRDVHDSSPRIAYARAVLMHMSNPNELTQRQLTFIAFLLERWAAKLEVLRDPIDEGDSLPLVADLAGERCPERVAGAPPQARAGIRYLDARKLAKSLKNRINLLRKGESPAQLSLGEDCVQPSCEQLLVFLFRQWCQPKAARLERRPAADAAKVSSDMQAIHYALSGKRFRDPGERRELTPKEREEMETLGRVSRREEAEWKDAPGFVLEEWQLEDESAQGLRMVRRGASPGGRLSHGQLVAVRPGEAKNFMLGQVRWLMGAGNGDVSAGVRLLPGLPQAIAVRATGLNAPNEKYLPALSLSKVPALNAPASLVLPPGWYKPKRVIELMTDPPTRVALTEVLDRGTDFERLGYEAAS